MICGNRRMRVFLIRKILRLDQNGWVNKQAWKKRQLKTNNKSEKIKIFNLRMAKLRWKAKQLNNKTVKEVDQAKNLKSYHERIQIPHNRQLNKPTH